MGWLLIGFGAWCVLSVITAIVFSWWIKTRPPMAALIGLVLMVSVAQTEDVEALAAGAGVDAAELQAAADTVGVAPAHYLATTPPHASPPPSTPLWTVWDSLARCEASGNWRAVSPGGRYRGGIQADATFWANYGGLAFAARPDLASREQQIIVAQRGLAVQGWRAWPVCSRVIGAR